MDNRRQRGYIRFLMTRSELAQLLDDIRSVSVAVIGDFCLDVYWFLDPAVGEMSVETGLEVGAVASERVSLGGAGNVAANLAALKAGHVAALGAVGDDMWGREMQRLLHAASVDCTGLVTALSDWSTLVYVKPHSGSREMSRFDMGLHNGLSDAMAATILASLEERLDSFDIVIVNEQVRTGIHTPFLRGALAEMIRRHSAKRFIVDSRHHAGAYLGAWLKVDEGTANCLAGGGAECIAQNLYAAAGKPVIVTCGASGCIVCDDAGTDRIQGHTPDGPTDAVGAGDTMLAALAVALAAGRNTRVAAAFGAIAASVTVRKLLCTGTASPEEILEAGE